MDIEERKRIIRDNIKWSTKERAKGGQSAGIYYAPITLKSEDLELEITFNFHRSRHKNKEFMMTLFELTLDELLNP